MIRKAVHKDAGRLCELRCEMLEVISGNRVTPKGRTAIEDFFYQQWNEQNPVYFVYELEEGIIGMAAVTIFPGMPSEKNPAGKCGLIYDVIVNKDYRRKGIGRLLVQQVLRFCQEQQVGFLHLNASEMGKEIYQSLGFEEYSACPEMRMYYHKIKQFY